MDSAGGLTHPAASVAEQVHRLAQTLDCEVVLDSIGGGSRTYRVDGQDHIVTVGVSWPADPPPAAELLRRATLQERIARRVTIPVPRVALFLPGAGLVVVRRLKGERLIDAAPALLDAVRLEVARAIGGLLGELHTWERDDYADVAVEDRYTPEEWRQETAELVHDLNPVLDIGQRKDVRQFLAQPAPSPAPVSVLSHNDLGIEHVLVATEGPVAITGVIDWDDAAICDPAYDFGLLLRDLGPEALETALASYAAAGGVASEISERAGFYARCTLLEDLAFGYNDGRPEYVAKSLAAWAPIFRE